MSILNQDNKTFVIYNKQIDRQINDLCTNIIIAHKKKCN